MLDALLQLILFAAKGIIIVVLTFLLIVAILAIISRGKEQVQGRLIVKNLNKKYKNVKEKLMHEILPKKLFKQYLKENKLLTKKKESTPPTKNIYILDFKGDMKATEVNSLSEEITAILSIAKTTDEVVVRLESPGGVVHAYGLAAAQLLRFRKNNIPLTIIVDKVAASGGYLMAAMANKIVAAPFAIIGSIGVLVQLPNFHRLLQDKKIDFEQLTAGNYKRTLTVFGQNTEEGRAKLKEEIEEIHQLFKNQIIEYRKELDIEKVATGEYWLGKQALALKLIDEIATSDDYLLNQNQEAALYEISYKRKKALGEKIYSTVQSYFNFSIF